MPNEITFGNSASEKSLMSTLDHYGSQISTALTYVSKANDDGALNWQEYEWSQKVINKYKEDSEELCDKPKRDMINYEALQGHPYQIIDNPDRDNGKGAKLYICKYSGWNKSFSKTWNLVYHFRTHYNNKPYKWEKCGREFAQKANFQRHMAVHNDVPLKDRKIFSCPKCSRSYSNKYNLNVSWFYNKY